LFFKGKNVALGMPLLSDEAPAGAVAGDEIATSNMKANNE